MFKKVFFVFVAMLIFLSVPVYAEDTYTLQPGHLYEFRIDQECRFVDIDFSDNVLYFPSRNVLYYDLTWYNYYGTSFAGDTVERKYLYVFNINDTPVSLTLNDGIISSVFDFPEQYVFTVVPFDGTRTPLEFINSHKYQLDIAYRILHYNDDGTFNLDSQEYSVGYGQTQIIDGKGVLIVDGSLGNYEIDYSFEGVYEVGHSVRSDFFQKPPWILAMNLNGILGGFLEILPKLLQAGLVVLSVFLLINLARYMVHLFL